VFRQNVPSWSQSSPSFGMGCPVNTPKSVAESKGRGQINAMRGNVRREFIRGIRSPGPLGLLARVSKSKGSFSFDSVVDSHRLKVCC
jgi:hypothetical protein